MEEIFKNETLAALGYWFDISKSVILNNLMSSYKREWVKEYIITDLQQKDDGGFLFKWEKRIIPLSESDLDNIFNNRPV